MRLLDVLFGTTTHVLHIGRYAQGLVFCRRQLLFEHLYAHCQVFTTGSLGSLVSIRILGIQSLFVSHSSSPFNYVSELDSRFCPGIWGRKIKVQGSR
ncbi:hypothetical protein D9M73_147030 [compost metagenome]